MCPACLRAAGGARAERWKFLTSPSSAARGPSPPMASSPIPAARSQYLLHLLTQVPDPRKRRGRRHRLAGLLAVGVAAVIAGSRSFAAIGQWAADAGPEVLAVLGAARGPAEESTFRGRSPWSALMCSTGPGWIGFDGAAQVAQLRRTVVKNGKKTVEVVYLITSGRSASSGDPGRLGPRPLAHREQAALGPRRHLPRGQVPGQDRRRTPRDGIAAKFGHQPPAPGRRHEHCRRQPPPRRDPQRTLKLLQAA
jgi:DDE_Tnp_1-associated